MLLPHRANWLLQKADARAAGRGQPPRVSRERRLLLA